MDTSTLCRAQDFWTFNGQTGELSPLNYDYPLIRAAIAPSTMNKRSSTAALESPYRRQLSPAVEIELYATDTEGFVEYASGLPRGAQIAALLKRLQFHVGPEVDLDELRELIRWRYRINRDKRRALAKQRSDRVKTMKRQAFRVLT
jgi:hypothetical protein